MLPTRIINELKQIDKKRTFCLFGFLFILAFFPIFFSDPSDKQENSAKTAVLAEQDIRANQAAPPSQPAPSQQQGGNAPANAAPTEPIVIPVQEEAYSPQPSIWLFIIPIFITFFTILFY